MDCSIAAKCQPALACFSTQNQHHILQYLALLELVGATLWTRISDDHSSRLASLISIGVFDQPYHGISNRALPV